MFNVILRGDEMTDDLLMKMEMNTKIIELVGLMFVRLIPKKHILYVSPPPFHHRCDTVLKKNNVTTKIVQKFPSAPQPPEDVVIMTLKQLFSVDMASLNMYDLSDYHIYFYDFQQYRVDTVSSIPEH